MQSAILGMGKESDMFWDKDAWGTPVTLTFLYYVILQHKLDFLSSNSFFMGLTQYGCCLKGAESPTSTSCSIKLVLFGTLGNTSLY